MVIMSKNTGSKFWKTIIFISFLMTCGIYVILKNSANISLQDYLGSGPANQEFYGKAVKNGILSRIKRQGGDTVVKCDDIDETEIEAVLICDKSNDCPINANGGYWDEDNCNCPANQFECGNTACIPIIQRCDGTQNCADNFDELNCPTTTSTTRKSTTTSTQPSTSTSTTIRTTTIDPACGGSFNGTNGILEYPIGNTNYANDRNCEWTITTSPGTVVRLQFESFQTEKDYDYLYIRDGTNIDSPNLDEYFYSGSTDIPTLTSTGNQVYLKFTSDNGNGFKGFKLIWMERKIITTTKTTMTSIMSTSTTSASTTPTTTSTTITTTNSPVPSNQTTQPSGTTTTPPTIEECGGIRVGNFGNIRYPDSGNYPNNAKCTWTVTTPPERAMEIIIFSFETEKNEDFLYIRDGDNENSKLLAKFTGILPSAYQLSSKNQRVKRDTQRSKRSPAQPIKSSCNKIHLQFTSNNANTNKGFELQFRDLGPASCTGICAVDEWLCHDGITCVPSNKICDRIVDCPDSSDEAKCNNGCNSNEFRCLDGLRCIPQNQRCDGICQCYDRSDELNCAGVCTSNEFQCYSGQCIPLSQKCDGYLQCNDGSDETYCPRVCTSNEFQCNSGQCIPLSQKCDGYLQCNDGSDETYCPSRCGPGTWMCRDGSKCIPENQKCDGYCNCFDSSDELNCPQRCWLGYWQCGDGLCVPQQQRCDGFYNCYDSSDEINCV